MPEGVALFSRPGRAALQAALRARPLLAFDFDGTLAPLVRDPDEARVPPVLALQLQELASRLPLAIVTGRSVADVAPRLGFAAGYIIGNHGVEEAGVAVACDVHPLEIMRGRLAGVVGGLSAAGIQVEDKGYSLALHYRQAPDAYRAVAAADAILGDLPAGLEIVPGRMVFNIVLAAAPDKGAAVASLVERTASPLALFIGDDINDESVFSRAPADWLTVRVGNDFAQTRARYFLPSYGDVEPLITTMLTMLEDG